ncbi:hypothetical protein C7B67_23705 [filamentous cyanobacterium Phorm 6]|nr:hypothetical protein C7B67_23705 [filamentous cyanobacterium Phorm 6]
MAGDNIFSGLELDKLLVAKDAGPRCDILKRLSPKYYDVQVIMVQKPMALGCENGEISQLITWEF